MKTHNDRPSTQKAAPAQPNRPASDPIRLGASGDKDAKPAAASAKPSGSGDSPKSAVDARAGGAAGAGVAKSPIPPEPKSGSPRVDTERKST